MLTATVISLILFFACTYLSCELLRENHKLNMYKNQYNSLMQLQIENQKKYNTLENENLDLQEKVKDLTTRLVVMKYLAKSLTTKQHLLGSYGTQPKKMGRGVFSEN